MKIEVIQPVPVPTMVHIEIPISVAQMIVVSLGRNHTSELTTYEKDAHYKFFSELSDKVGRGPFKSEVRDRDSMWLLTK